MPHNHGLRLEASYCGMLFVKCWFPNFLDIDGTNKDIKYRTVFSDWSRT